MSYRIVIISWRIVMHTMCSWNILLDGRVSVHIMRSRDVLDCDWIVDMRIMCSRDVLECDWIVDMRSLSYRIVIVSWCIVVHTNTNKLSERILLLHSRICVHIMLGWDIY